MTPSGKKSGAGETFNNLIFDTGTTNTISITAPAAGTYMLLGYALDLANNKASAQYC